MGACGLKKLCNENFCNKNETKLTKIPYSFPGLLQPVSKKKQDEKAKKNRTSNFKKNQAYQVRGGNTKWKLPYKTKLTT